MAATVMHPNMLNLFVTLVVIGQVRSIDVNQVNRDLQAGGEHLCKYCWACVYAEHCDWACFFRVSEYCDFCVYSFHCYTTCPFCVAMNEATLGHSESSTVTARETSMLGDDFGMVIKLTTPITGTMTEKSSLPTGGTFKHKNASEKGFSANFQARKESEDGENSKADETIGMYSRIAAEEPKRTAVDNSEISNNGGFKPDNFQSSGDDDGNQLQAIHYIEADDISSSGDDQETVKA